jgi:hypothetical protein
VRNLGPKHSKPLGAVPLENLCLQGLLAKQPMKCANLVLQGSVGRHDFFATAGCGQTASRHQVTPLVWGNVMPASHLSHLDAEIEGLLHHPNVL